MRVKIENGVLEQLDDVADLKKFISAAELAALRQQFRFDDDPETNDAYFDRALQDDIRTTTRGAVLADVRKALMLRYWFDQLGDKMPSRLADDAMLHFLYPEAHASAGRGSPLFTRAAQVINAAQSNQLSGNGMLRTYANYVAIILDRPAEVEIFLGRAPDTTGMADRRNLAADAIKGSRVGDALATDLDALAIGRSLILSFEYEGHQTYVRMVKEAGGYRVEYFDRQRQSMILDGANVRGYYDGETAQSARPIRFTFNADAKDVASIYTEAKRLAAQHGSTGDARRAEALQYFAARAAGVAEFGELEPQQHIDAINCAWASLESCIRACVGQPILTSELEFMRKVVLERSVIPSGTAEERQVAGLPPAV